MTVSEAIEQLKIEFIGEYERQREAKRIAIKTLEKQIPKKPIEMKLTDKLLNGYFACPICSCWVGTDEYSNNYCGFCGQKIDWE